MDSGLFGVLNNGNSSKIISHATKKSGCQNVSKKVSKETPKMELRQ